MFDNSNKAREEVVFGRQKTETAWDQKATTPSETKTREAVVTTIEKVIDVGENNEEGINVGDNNREIFSKGDTTETLLRWVTTSEMLSVEEILTENLAVK